LADKWFIYL